MNRVISFISGSEYSLSSLFGGDTKIIIPDLQRDYCWGDKAVVDIKTKKTKELVSDFVKNIVEQFLKDSETSLTMGLVYGYEQPHNHIQICDGQQRLTTLFLLLGVLNKKTEGAFDDYIISKAEREDDYEPHLQYAIRESTLYFLSDLSRRVFIERSTDIKDVKRSNWYFSEYDFDASIQSMISAVQIIDDIISSEGNLDYQRFGLFILNNLKVLYYDMENRSRGEETYVVINTTGEPLSATENIKPILLGKESLSDADVKKYSDQWEEREEWFWQNRGIDTVADSGLQDFFMWYWQIGLMQERAWKDDKPIPLNPRELFLNAPTKINENSNEVKLSLDNYNRFASLDNINKYFLALKELVGYMVSNDEFRKILKCMSTKKQEKDSLSDTPSAWSWLRKSDLVIVLPLLTLLAEHQGTNMLIPFTRRLRRNYFDYLWTKNDDGSASRRSASKMDWRYLVQIINLTTDENLLTVDVGQLPISKIPLIQLPAWYDEEEQKKDVLRVHGYSKEIDCWEDNEYLMGDLTPLWNKTNIEELSFDALSRRFCNFRMCCVALDEKQVAKEKKYEFANWFRLYKAISGLTSFGHVPNCQWSFEGCYFSKRPITPWWLESPQINKLLEAEDMIVFMKGYVKEKVKDFLSCPNDHVELLKSWLTIKTLKATKDETLLDYNGERAISAYKELKDNYILPSEDFSWGNVLLGYSYSYTIYPARKKETWEVGNHLDTPLYPIKFIGDYFVKEKHHLSEEDSKSMNQYICDLIEEFLESNNVFSDGESAN